VEWFAAMTQASPLTVVVLSLQLVVFENVMLSVSKL